MYFESLNLLFVHLPKTGGESIVQALAPAGFIGPKHATYREFRLSCPEWDRQRPTVACFVRNPWDQVVSFYSHLRKPAYLPRDQISAHPEYFTEDGFLHPAEVSRSACEQKFPQWVARWYARRPHHARLSRTERWPWWLHHLRRRSPTTPGYYRYYREDANKYLLPYLEWISTPRGGVRADFIGRFETLQDDFHRLCTQIGYRADLPHMNRSRHGYYRDHYDCKTRQCIADYFAPEIARLGYQY